MTPTAGGAMKEEGGGNTLPVLWQRVLPGERSPWRPGLPGRVALFPSPRFVLSCHRETLRRSLTKPALVRGRVLGGKSVGWRRPEEEKRRPLSKGSGAFGFSRPFPDRFASPRFALRGGFLRSRFPMSGDAAASEESRCKASALGSQESGGSGDRCCPSGAEEQEKRVALPPLPPPPENEDSTQKSVQEAIASEKDILPCRLQNGSPVNSDTTNDPASSNGSPEEQDVIEEEEILTDQLQHQKEEAVLQETKFSTPEGPGDVIMIQSEYTGAVDILSADLETTDLLSEQKKARPPPLIPPTLWTNSKIREFKAQMAKEKNARMLVKRGEVLTVRVPTHPDGKRVCWEFATEDYDIGFGVYFDWTPITSTAITVQVSESSDEEDEEEEFEGTIPVGDVEKGAKGYLRNRYGEIMPVYRRDSHQEVQIGSHDYPGEGIYLLKFDNSYSLLRNKILFFHVYYAT